MGLRVILPVLLGWLLMKYALLGSASFETSFQWGMFYHATALISLAIGSTWMGIRGSINTPDFLDGFKLVAKDVISYAVGATALVSIWHHWIMKGSTLARLEDLKNGMRNRFESETAFQEYLTETGFSNELKLSDWLEHSIGQAELLYAPSIQFSLSLMVYLVIGLFISLIASFLWTKVWFTQQTEN
jgi:hypothetical protein